METILAVDLKKGKVVRAFAGFRLNYKPLKNTKYNLESPVNFINKVLTLFAISKVYVADLDSIQNSGSNFDLISKLLNTFQHLTFLIDNGFDYPKSVKTFCEQLKKKNLYNFIPVVGTENLRNYNFQSYKFLNKLFRHIDFGGELSIGKHIQLRIGYNSKRRQELKVDSYLGMVGFSWGLGIKISHFTINYGRSSYHLHGSPNYFSFSTSFSKFYK